MEGCACSGSGSGAANGGQGGVVGEVGGGEGEGGDCGRGGRDLDLAVGDLDHLAVGFLGHEGGVRGRAGGWFGGCVGGFGVYDAELGGILELAGAGYDDLEAVVRGVGFERGRGRPGECPRVGDVVAQAVNWDDIFRRAAEKDERYGAFGCGLMDVS